MALFGLAGCNTVSEVATVPAVDQVAPTATVQNAGTSNITRRTNP
jgi:hypothetical protein